jgi:hypothetical protein
MAAPEYQDGKSIVVLSAMEGSYQFRVTTSVNSERSAVRETVSAPVSKYPANDRRQKPTDARRNFSVHTRHTEACGTTAHSAATESSGVGLVRLLRRGCSDWVRSFCCRLLTTQKWTQVDIGLVLTAAGLVALWDRSRAGCGDAVRI